MSSLSTRQKSIAESKSAPPKENKAKIVVEWYSSMFASVMGIFIGAIYAMTAADFHLHSNDAYLIFGSPNTEAYVDLDTSSSSNETFVISLQPTTLFPSASPTTVHVPLIPIGIGSMNSTAPTFRPTMTGETLSPTVLPTTGTKYPTTKAPTRLPSSIPTMQPITLIPSSIPSSAPTGLLLTPTTSPNVLRAPSVSPTSSAPSNHPTDSPYFRTNSPTQAPSVVDSPTSSPSVFVALDTEPPATVSVSDAPSLAPTGTIVPTNLPSYSPTTTAPSFSPTIVPSFVPSTHPLHPTSTPTESPTVFHDNGAVVSYNTTVLYIDYSAQITALAIAFSVLAVVFCFGLCWVRRRTINDWFTQRYTVRHQQKWAGDNEDEYIHKQPVASLWLAPNEQQPKLPRQQTSSLFPPPYLDPNSGLFQRTQQINHLNQQEQQWDASGKTTPLTSLEPQSKSKLLAFVPRGFPFHQHQGEQKTDAIKVSENRSTGEFEANPETETTSRSSRSLSMSSTSSSASQQKKDAAKVTENRNTSTTSKPDIGRASVNRATGQFEIALDEPDIIETQSTRSSRSLSSSSNASTSSKKDAVQLIDNRSSGKFEVIPDSAPQDPVTQALPKNRHARSMSMVSLPDPLESLKKDAVQVIEGRSKAQFEVIASPSVEQESSKRRASINPSTAISAKEDIALVVENRATAEFEAGMEGTESVLKTAKRVSFQDEPKPSQPVEQNKRTSGQFHVIAHQTELNE